MPTDSDNIGLLQSFELSEIIDKLPDGSDVSVYHIAFHPPLKNSIGDEINSLDIEFPVAQTEEANVAVQMGRADAQPELGRPNIVAQEISDFLAAPALEALRMIRSYYDRGFGDEPARDKMLLVINLYERLAEELWRENEWLRNQLANLTTKEVSASSTKTEPTKASRTWIGDVKTWAWY